MTHITLIGFGEAAQAFVSGWAAPEGYTLSCYDIKITDSQTSPVARAARELGVTPESSAERALAQADLVFSLVTADQAVFVAREYAPFLHNNALWLDCNSCAPSSKITAAGLVGAAGGRYVDVAVMAPVYPKRHHVPLLLAGPHASEAETALKALDMRPEQAGAEIGAASSVKMIRSVMIKGMEALTAECMLAARQAGVAEAVLASLQSSDPDTDWQARGNYNLERMMVHGTRRAAEMREVARTVAELGLPADMAQATVDWQSRIGALDLKDAEDGLDLRSEAVIKGLAKRIE